MLPLVVPCRALGGPLLRPETPVPPLPPCPLPWLAAAVRLPAVQTGGMEDDVFISADLKRALQAAAKMQKKKGDSFLGE